MNRLLLFPWVLLYRNLEFLTISSQASLDIDTSWQRSRIVAMPVRTRNDIVGTCTQDCEIIWKDRAEIWESSDRHGFMLNHSNLLMTSLQSRIDTKSLQSIYDFITISYWYQIVAIYQLPSIKKTLLWYHRSLKGLHVSSSYIDNLLLYLTNFVIMKEKKIIK